MEKELVRDVEDVEEGKAYEEVITTDLTELVFFADSSIERVPARAGLRMSVSASVCIGRGSARV